ncbi:RHS repeat-associated core domain-containing protein [Dactylosporangium sp. NPDC048998]|uniref:RHS repeat-associated core domain-containing protein n=1 Tax=Dactylosporangium sp. NPDC048998 TaxID=3363976 RepID=UPI0037130D0B
MAPSPATPGHHRRARRHHGRQRRRGGPAHQPARRRRRDRPGQQPRHARRRLRLRRVRPGQDRHPGPLRLAGASQRSNEALDGTTLMGVRLYSAAQGRFLSIDPISGGNAYDYCNGDGVNCTDISGRYFCSFRSWWSDSSHKWGMAVYRVSDRDINTDWPFVLGVIGAGVGAWIGGVPGAVIGALIGLGVVWAYNRGCTHHRGMYFTGMVMAHKVWRLSYPDYSLWWISCI